jgi:hypothetical protein
VEPDWEAQIVRAYNTFGIDPLDGTEFGLFGGRLSPSFLREKAERQIRDALGRWRAMRGRLDGGDRLSPVARLSSPEPTPEQSAWDVRHRGGFRDYIDRLDASGVTAPPLVLGGEEFDAYQGADLGWRDPVLPPTSGTVLHRGMKDHGAPADQKAATIQQAPASEHFIGNGIHGPGIYFGGATDALRYGGDPEGGLERLAAGEQIIAPEGTVMRAKFHPDTTVVSFVAFNRMQDAERARIRGLGLPPEETDRLLREAGLKGTPPDVFAALRGIDVIDNGSWGPSANFNVINRSRLVLDGTGVPRFAPPPPRP